MTWRYALTGATFGLLGLAGVVIWHTSLQSTSNEIKLLLSLIVCVVGLHFFNRSRIQDLESELKEMKKQ